MGLYVKDRHYLVISEKNVQFLTTTFETDPIYFINTHNEPTEPSKKSTKKRFRDFSQNLKGRLPTLPQLNAVPSAQMSLTSLFGMGRGGTSPLLPP